MAVAEYEPVIDGLHPGQIVEIAGASEGEQGAEFVGGCGQLQGYSPEEDAFDIILLSGEKARVSRKNVNPASGAFKKPGEGGDPDSFDIVLGPRTLKNVLGQELADCLATKGFCVMKALHTREDLRATADAVKELEASNQFGRLAQEIEEGHLGKAGRAKALWYDPESQAMPSYLTGSLLERNDSNMSTLAQLLQPYCNDILGYPVSDRTPALLCLSMQDAEEAEYEAPSATDEELEEYYTTWCRSAVRLVHFMGPSTCQVVLSPKSSCTLTGALQENRIEAAAGTLIAIREDCFEYSFEEPDNGEVMWMQCLLLRPGNEFSMDSGPEGSMEILGAQLDGPPPPTVEQVSVVAMAIQAAANMYDKSKEWAAYLAGTDGQLFVPLLRFDVMPYYNEEHDNPQGTTFCKHVGLQEGVDMFDNKIFEISVADASAMDPQCRQVLEVGGLCLMQRGITKKHCNTNAIHAAVSVGCDKEEWLNLPGVPTSVATNNQLAITANRFNYVFNLKGASYVCDTACSSSLIATHLGKLNLMEDRWDPLEFHLAMGTNLTLTVGLQIGACAAHMLSPAGRCLTFNATASGYNRGDGTAGMMLKRGDVEGERMVFLRGTQIGEDGRSASLSAPNGPAQEKCIWGATREARMTPPESTVWECHGTGTSLGDPIEVGAVRKVQIRMPRLEPLMISTSKSNIGHLEGSAAMVAMCKCIMTVLKVQCAPTQHFKTLNPHLDHTKFDAIFCTELNPYKYKQGHCQVSSFGVGGANGHAIFWGRDMRGDDNKDWSLTFLRKLLKLPSPIVVHGTNPADWDYNGLPVLPEEDGASAKLRVAITKDPLDNTVRVNYERLAENKIPFDEDEDEEFPTGYVLIGSHSDYSEERMMDGDVDGHFMAYVEIPEEGHVDFFIMRDGHNDKCYGPEVEASTSRHGKVVGPVIQAQRNCWRIIGKPEDSYRIEFLLPRKATPTVTWFKEIRRGE